LYSVVILDREMKTDTHGQRERAEDL